VFRPYPKQYFLSQQVKDLSVLADRVDLADRWRMKENAMAKHRDKLIGTEDGDTLTGDRHDNVIRGLGGDDILSGLGGKDTIVGGAGNDDIRGGAGDDRLTDGIGDDMLFGGSGDDEFDIIGGHDAVAGGDGEDIVIVDGNFADWQIEREGMTNDLTMTRGDQIVTTTQVELIQFDDGVKQVQDPGPL
jgi:hypothetical protein